VEYEGDKATEALHHVTCDISKIIVSQRGNPVLVHPGFFFKEESSFNADLIDGQPPKFQK